MLMDIFHPKLSKTGKAIDVGVDFVARGAGLEGQVAAWAGRKVVAEKFQKGKPDAKPAKKEAGKIISSASFQSKFKQKTESRNQDWASRRVVN